MKRETTPTAKLPLPRRRLALGVHGLAHLALVLAHGLGDLRQLAQREPFEPSEVESGGLDEPNKVSTTDDTDFPPLKAAGMRA